MYVTSGVAFLVEIQNLYCLKNGALNMLFVVTVSANGRGRSFLVREENAMEAEIRVLRQLIPLSNVRVDVMLAEDVEAGSVLELIYNWE